MPEPALRFNPSFSRQPSFPKRIQENLQSVWRLPNVAAAAGAPIHLLEESPRKGSLAAHFGSIGAHVLVFSVLIYIVLHPAWKADPAKMLGPANSNGARLIAPKWLREAEDASRGRRGSSGGDNPLPPTSGDLAPMSRILLARPRPADGQPHPLPITVTTFDPEAPDILTPAKNLGLPWMNERNGSEGTGKNGIGTGQDGGMGTGIGDGSGEANSSLAYAAVATPVACLHCPDPLYSDEARKAKLQGSVTMRVLVGADGRAERVLVTRRIGLGLDENAVLAVSGWHFSPAKDSARRPIPTWITIETVFRLF